MCFTQKLILVNRVWTIYTVTTSMLLFRFLRNIRKLSLKAKSNPVVDYQIQSGSIKKKKHCLTLEYYFH
jgi:hypothetical protein